MAGVKSMLMYPRPQDIDEPLYQDENVPIGDGLSSEYARTFEAFEKLYQEEHVPMILDKLVGKTPFVATRDRSPQVAQRIREPGAAAAAPGSASSLGERSVRSSHRDGGRPVDGLGFGQANGESPLA